MGEAMFYLVAMLSSIFIPILIWINKYEQRYQKVKVLPRRSFGSRIIYKK